MNDVMRLVEDIRAKIGSNYTPMMAVLRGTQMMVVLSVMTAAKRGDAAEVARLGKQLALSLEPTQRPALVGVLGEELVQRLEALR